MKDQPTCEFCHREITRDSAPIHRSGQCQRPEPDWFSVAAYCARKTKEQQ